MCPKRYFVAKATPLSQEGSLYQNDYMTLWNANHALWPIALGVSNGQVTNIGPVQ